MARGAGYGALGPSIHSVGRSGCCRRTAFGLDCERPKRIRHVAALDVADLAQAAAARSCASAHGASCPFAATTPSQLGGDLEAEGPRLTRRDVVVVIRRGPIALVEDVLDIELRLPGRGDLRIDAGVYIQHALPVVQQRLLNAGIRLAKIIDEDF